MNDLFEEDAKEAVGSALLFRVSKNGGSFGFGLDEQRAEKLAAEQIGGDAMYALLLDVAGRAGKKYRNSSMNMRAQLIREIKRLAVETDSLRLHQFIESFEIDDEH